MGIGFDADRLRVAGMGLLAALAMWPLQPAHAADGVRPYLGVSTRTIDADLKDGLGVDHGVVIVSVGRGSAAQRAGLRAMDIVTGVDGQPINSAEDFTASIGAGLPGMLVAIDVLRDGKPMSLRATLMAAPTEIQPPDRAWVESKLAAADQPGRNTIGGATITTLTPAIAEPLEISALSRGAVVLNVEPGSSAEQVGLRKGDAIFAINGKRTLTAASAATLFASATAGDHPAVVAIGRGAEFGLVPLTAKARAGVVFGQAPEITALRAAYGDLAPYIFEKRAGTKDPVQVYTVFKAVQNLGDRNRSPYYVKFGWSREKTGLVLTEWWMDREWGPLWYSYYASKKGTGHFERTISGYSTKTFDVNADGSISGMGRLRNENGFNTRLIVYKQEGDGLSVRLYRGPVASKETLTEEYILERADPKAYDLAANAYKQQKADEKAAKQANGGGGLLGVLGTVAQAAAVVSDNNLYRQTMIGAMNQGVPGLGSAVGAVSGGGNGAVGGVGSGRSGGGSYPKKPNLAMGSQCPGFTMGNYRTYALQGGNDQQLFSLCGQAFEYYHMYENAIAQGYSEADANRTYAAHEDSARVATDFYRNAR
jgi:membrane-associated protease RseP (regulator of RpoE activity)